MAAAAAPVKGALQATNSAASAAGSSSATNSTANRVQAVVANQPLPQGAAALPLGTQIVITMYEGIMAQLQAQLNAANAKIAQLEKTVADKDDAIESMRENCSLNHIINVQNGWSE